MGVKVRRNPIPDQRCIAPDTPLRLDVAASLAYPDGSMTASGLRREAAKGRLVIERTAGKDYTTLQAIEHMRMLCRVPGNAPASGSALNGGKTEGSLPMQPGSSSMPASTSPQDALRAKLRRQKGA